MATKVEHLPAVVGEDYSSPAYWRCSRHPSYQAKRPPTSGCVPCQTIYDKKQKARDLLSQAASAFADLGTDVEIVVKLKPGVRFGRGLSWDGGCRLRIERLK